MGGICGASGDTGPLEHTGATLAQPRPDSGGPFGVGGAPRRLRISDSERRRRRRVEREPGPVRRPEPFAA